MLTITYSGLYKDEVWRYIERFGSSGEGLPGIGIQILLYVDDIVLMFGNPEELWFVQWTDKTKMVVLNTT